MPDLTDIFYFEKSNWIRTIFWNSLYVAFLLLPLGINLPTPFFVGAIALGVVNIFQSKTDFVSDNKALLLLPLYFVLGALSLFYTHDLSAGIELLIRSLSLLFFPIIFLFVKEDASTVKKLFDFLLVGLILSFFVNVGIALQDSLADIDKVDYNSVYGFFDSIAYGFDNFIGGQFSSLVNPSYLSLYILLVLSYYLKKKMKSVLQLVVLLILFLYIFLLASKAAYLVLFIMTLLFVIKIRDKNQQYMALVILLLGLIVFLNNPRIFDFYQRIKDYDRTEQYNELASEKSRLQSWDASVQLIKEQPIFGYGLGDANQVLIDKYEELEYNRNKEEKYNAHNQFLQTMLQTGILGLGVLITIFIVLGKRLRRSKNEFAVFLILFVSLFFESMLVRFNGIVFLSIIIPLLLKKRSILSSRIIRN
ncbi:O-antigen ligase family protein [Spongiivirga sp. MCCC 1A20706]|uniref:O-antigen ligase family protein n=1 Tax=Spongiivirga sp. MCCC 1A20706 TaxID=3160963 RepID=UPI003977851B